MKMKDRMSENWSESLLSFVFKKKKDCFLEQF